MKRYECYYCHEKPNNYKWECVKCRTQTEKQMIESPENSEELVCFACFIKIANNRKPLITKAGE